MIPLREIDLLGVFVAPFAVCIPIALALTCAAILLLDRHRNLVGWKFSALFELTVFAVSLSMLVLMLGRF